MIAVVVLLFFLLRRLSAVLLPFMVSWLLAYLSEPLVRFYQHRCHLRNRLLSVTLALLTIAAGLVAFGLLLIPPMIHEISLLSGYISDYLNTFDAERYLSPEMAARYESLVQTMNVRDLMSNPDVMAVLQRLSPHLWRFLSGSLSAASSVAVIFVCLLYIFFILLDYDHLADSWASFVPQRYRHKARRIMADLSENLNAYFRGQAKVAACVGALFALGFELCGLPMGLSMGLFIGLLNMVPYMQMLAIPPCLILALIQAAETGRPVWLCVTLLVVVFVIVQSLQDLVLTPKIMGKATGLNPAMILLALSVWGSLLGILGMIIALPFTSLIVSYYKQFYVSPETTDTPARE